MRRLAALATSFVVALAPAVVAQAPGDGVFAPGERRAVWKSAAAYEHWQRKAESGSARRAEEGSIVCVVDPGAPFAMRFAMPPHGFGIEVTEGSQKGCQGFVPSGAVTLHVAPAAPAPPPATGKAPAAAPAPSAPQATTPGRAHPIGVSPMVPPLPPGGALPIRPGLR